MAIKNANKHDWLDPNQPYAVGSGELVRLACDDWRCGWHGDSESVLRAPDPFNEGCALLACPKCREQTIRTCCDKPECWEQDTCGTPTPNGYRRTCGRHHPYEKPLPERKL